MYDLLTTILTNDLHLTTTIHPDTTCHDAGLDSLAMVELSMILQTRHNMNITDDELLTTKRISDIINLMQQHTNP